MTSVGCVEVTRCPDGGVDFRRSDGGPGIRFTRKEWEEILFGPDSHRLRYGALPWATWPDLGPRHTISL